MNQRLKNSLLGFASLALTVLPAGVLLAEEWMDFRSTTGVYNVRMAEGYKTSTMEFMIDDKLAVHSEEISAVVDQRPYKNAVKTYVVKFDQSIGPPLTKEEVAQLLANELNSYVNYYKGMEGVVRSRNQDGYDKHHGGEIMISYRDPDLGVQSLRTRILFGDGTRLQQMVIGSEELMNSYQTRDFFESLQFDPGISQGEATLKSKSNVMESPTGMFTLYYPAQKAPPYFTHDPVTKFDDKNEMVSVFFNDPVRNEKIIFNVYGYQFGTELTYDSVQEVLIKRHITPQRGTVKGVKFSKGITQGDAEGNNRVSYMETSYAIQKMKDYPYISMVKLRAFFSGTTMLVQETMASNALHNSSLAKIFMENVIYQPSKMHAAVTPVAISAEPNAPVDTTPKADMPSVPANRRIGPVEETPKEPPLDPPATP